MAFEKHDLSKVRALYRIETRLVEDSTFEYFGGAIKSPRDFHKLFSRLGEKDREHGIVLFLDHEDFPIGYDLYLGAIDMVIIDPRQVFKVAWLVNATKFAVCHNHPHGYDAFPSTGDEAFAIQLAQIAPLMGFKILDFMVICKDKYFSFREFNHPAIQLADKTTVVEVT